MLSGDGESPSLGDGLDLKSTSDAMAKLPPEVLQEILLYLSGDEILAFSTASLAVLRATSGSYLWKRKIPQEMPWFWELDRLIGDSQSRNMDLDYRRLYLWLKSTTREWFGNKSPFLGLTNRSRIWWACGKLADLYFQKVDAGE